MPQFLRQLYLRVFDESGSLKEDYDETAIFFLRQVLYGAKRTSIQCSDEAVEKEITEFVQVDFSSTSREILDGREPAFFAHTSDLRRILQKSVVREEGARTAR
jgi:hypothetical protein